MSGFYPEILEGQHTVNALAPMQDWQNVLLTQQNRYHTMADTQRLMANTKLELEQAKQAAAGAGLTQAQTGMVGAQTVGQQINNQLSGYRAGWTGQVFGDRAAPPQPPSVQLPWGDSAPPNGTGYGGETGRELVTPGAAGSIHPPGSVAPTMGRPGTVQLQYAPDNGPQSSAAPTPGQPGGNALASLRSQPAGNTLAAAAAASDVQTLGQPVDQNGNPTAAAGPQIPAQAFQQVSPNGMMIPGMGMPMPKMWSGFLFSPDPAKAVQGIITQRRQMLSQMLSGATDPASWNATVRNAYDQGYITAGRAWQLYNHFDQRDAVERSFATPESQVGYQSTLAPRGFTPGPNGPQPNAPMLNAKGPITVTKAVKGPDGQWYNVQVQEPRAGYVQSTTQAASPAAAANGEPGAPGAPAASAGAPPAAGAGPAASPQGMSWAQYSGALARRESGANPAVGQNPRSSATGLYQFTQDGWLHAFRQAYPEMSNISDQQALAMRGDAEAQQRVLPFYTRDNIAGLQAQRIPVNAATLALAHQLGPAGEAAVLKAPADAALARVLPREVIQANPQLARMRVGDLIQQTKANFPLVPVQMPGTETGRQALGLEASPRSPAAPGAGGAPPALPPAEASSAGLVGGGTPIRVSSGPSPAEATAGAPPGSVAGMPEPSPQARANIDLEKQAGSASIQQMQKMREGLQQASDGAAQMNGLIDQMRQESQSWQQGAFASAKGRAMYFLDSMGQQLGFKPNQSVGDWQAFNKNAMQLTTQAVRATSAHAAVQEFEMIRGALPSDSTSPQGFRQIADELEGINDWRIAKSYAAGQWKGQANEFDAKWNAQISPTAFIVNRMSAQDVAALAHNLNRTAAGKGLWQKIVNDMQLLSKSGVLQRLNGPR